MIDENKKAVSDFEKNYDINPDSEDIKPMAENLKEKTKELEEIKKDIEDFIDENKVKQPSSR